jgi:PAS domain S-box-containing protein
MICENPAGRISNLRRSIPENSRGLLIGVTCVGLAALVVVATMVMVVLDRKLHSEAAIERVEHTHAVIVAIDNVLASISDIETGERGFLLTAEAAFLQPYDGGIATLWNNFHEVERLTADNPEQRQNSAILENLLRSKLVMVSHIIDLARGGDRVGAIDIVRGGSSKVVMDKVRQSAAAMINAENLLLRERIKQQVNFQLWATGLIVGLLIAAAGGIFLCAILIIGRLLGSAGKLRAILATTERDQRLAMMDLAAIMWRDPEGVIQFWSEGCRRIYGWTAEQVVGRSMRDQIETVSPNGLGAVDVALLRDGEWSGERRDRAADGTEIIVAVHKIARRDADGRVFAIVETVTDVTELRHAETALRVSQTQFRAVVDVALDGIIVAHSDGRIMTANQAALRMFGYDGIEELIGRDLGVLMPAPEAARHRTHIASHQAGAPPRAIGVPGLELLAIRRDGSDFPVDVSVSSFETEGRHYLTGTIRDITERKRFEAALLESEKRLRLLANHVSQFVWIADGSGSARWFNQRWYDYTGTTLEQMQGWGWRSVLHPDHVDRVVERIQRSFDSGSPWEDTFPLRGRDGQYRWFLSRALPVRNADGVIEHWFGTNTDVTDQHDASDAIKNEHRNALRQSEEHARLALSAVNSIGTYNWDIVSDRVYGNGSFARIFGMDPDRAAAGAPIAEYLVNVPADARAKMLLEYKQATRTGGDCSVIHPVNQPDGSVRWCLAKSCCVLAPDGTPLRMTGVLIDITDQRIVEDQLRQSQKMEAVGQLTGGLAHDFNNMLQGITGSLELLKARLASGRLGNVDRYITAAQDDAARAATLTQRLLAFSRQQVLDPVPTNADELIAGMADMVQRTVGPAIKIVVVPTTGLWTTLCDSNQMENALLNLCINARDAMPEGGRLTIETGNVLLDRRGAYDWDVMPGEYVAVCVTDTGIGMPLDVIARAFDPFFTTKPQGVGTGLGLSMIHGFAQQSGGQARIHSEVGVGTTVRIYLPRHLDIAELEKKLLPAVETSPGAGAGQTVLIVDDEPSVRMQVTDVLQEHGYITIEAEDGASGLKVLQSVARIDLLISDVGLPGGMNGRQMADAARIGRPDLKVLFITGYAPSGVVGSGRLEQGMHVMTKPFALDALAARVNALISEVAAV